MNNLSRRFIKLFFSLISIVFIISISNTANADAASLKLKYNNRTRIYKGKQVDVYLDSKKVAMDKTKGVVLNKTLMVSYKDVFKKACGIKTTYNSKTGKIVLKGNGVTVRLKLNRKTAYINGKKKNLKQAPVKVRYVKKKKTKVLIPAKVISKAFGYTYSYSSDTAMMTIKSPYVLEYNGAQHIYKKYFGGLVYNNITADMNYMPALSIGCTMIPAEQVLKNIMGLEYTYDKNAGKITVKALNNKLDLVIGSKTALINDTTPVTLKTAPTIVKRMDTKAEAVMVPAATVMAALDYYYSWNSSLNIITIQTKNYFSWKADDNTDYDKTLYNNSLTKADAVYDNNNKNIVIKLLFEKALTADSFTFTDNIISGRTAYLDFPKTKNLLQQSEGTINTGKLQSVKLEQNGDLMDNLRFTLLFSSTDASMSYKAESNMLTITISQEVNKDYALRISKPEEVAFTDIKTNDDYTNKRFMIYIPGNYTDYYNTNKISVSSSVVTGTQVSYKSDGYTEIIVNTSKLQGYKLVSFGDVIGVIVDNPVNVYDNIVVLDAGHGGNDPGASGGGYDESDITLEIIYNKAKEYFNSTDSNVKAYWTRTDDTFITLSNRAAYASLIGAEMFVSLHMNSSNSSAAKGTEVYYSTVNNNVADNGMNSKKLAGICLDNIISALKTTNRGVKTANYYVIKHNSVPAVLIELGFISNSSDRRLITDAASQKAAAKAIYDSVIAAFNN